MVSQTLGHSHPADLFRYEYDSKRFRKGYKKTGTGGPRARRTSLYLTSIVSCCEALWPAASVAVMVYVVVLFGATSKQCR